MSQQIVERYLGGVEACNRGALDEWLQRTVTPGWELVTGGAFPGLAPVYRGREGALELWNALRGPWDNQDLHLAVERIEDLVETVVVLLTMRASGGASGVPVGIQWARVITVGGGDQRIHSYASWDDALQAAGLEK